ncbi:MAG: carbohydrate binding family 9 domain-containing protein [Bacteroidota bacterium]|nr:carbohydrate binding family 9 domain-containing protein [Bacteroidota bacterium]
MKSTLIGLFFFFTLAGYGQKKNAAYQYHIFETNQHIKIDGVPDEPIWKTCQDAGNFYMVLPMDTSYAKVKTDVYMTYDKNNLYLLAICHDTHPQDDMVESLARDFNFLKNDNFIVFIDPFDDQTNGFAFGTNADGAQWDGLMYQGGSVDLNWDNKWRSAVKHYPDKWVLEMAIPFSTMRFKKGVKEWGINFSRNDLRSTEKSSWAPVPRQFPTAALAYTGTLVWDNPPPAPKANISLIPYLLTGRTRDLVPSSNPVFRHSVGINAKVGITSSLNLDLTVNPDFSQVEVDQQVTNLDRYELFFPERRQFFLENGDQINNFGYADIRPFFSRRIGLGVPIEYGGRLSGKLNKNWRVTVMDMQTSSVDSLGLPQQNFGVVALQRSLFSRSNINFLFVNKQSVHYAPGKDSTHPVYSEYNRNIGFEYNLASSNNVWTGKWMILKSFSPGVKNGSVTQAANLQYSGKRWLIGGAYEYVGSNYNAEVGYVPRLDYIKLNPQIDYLFFPKGGSILSHGPQLTMNYFYDTKFRETDHMDQLTYLITFRNKATLSATGDQEYVKVLFPFDPTNSGKDSLQVNNQNWWNTVGADFSSKLESLLSYGASVRYGGYYAGGKKVTLSGSVGYRIQPILNFTLMASFNRLLLPNPWGHTTFWLVGPKVDLTLTNKLFFTTYVQYNEQLNNTNVNARFQWRYKPACDLFLVYTDNYLIAPFAIRNRSLLLKFTYWWNHK